LRSPAILPILPAIGKAQPLWLACAIGVIRTCWLENFYPKRLGQLNEMRGNCANVGWVVAAFTDAMAHAGWLSCVTLNLCPLNKT
jgi:predicted outer membrane lipoprotein